MNKDSLYNLFNQVANKSEVPIKLVLDTFFILRSGNPIDNNKLLRRVGVSRNALNKLKKYTADLLEPSSTQTRLKRKMAKQVKNLYPPSYKLANELLCLGQKDFKPAFKLINDIRKNENLTPKRNLDQFSATAQTTVKRAILMDFLADIRGRRILFLGDGDLTSLAVASFNKTKKITVADIDKDILNKIKSHSDKNAFGIETLVYDARSRLPRNLDNKFDVVFTDPPYAPSGMKLFISRAISALDKKNSNSRLYLCYGNSDRAKERYLPILKTLIDSGLIIRFAFDRFNRYQGAESIGSSSSLFVCEVTPATKSLLRDNYSSKIYTWER